MVIFSAENDLSVLDHGVDLPSGAVVNKTMPALAHPTAPRSSASSPNHSPVQRRGSGEALWV